MDFGLSVEEIEKINSVFRKYPNVRNAIIYGSRAKQAYRPYSDIDLVLEGENVTLQEIFSIETDLEALSLPYEFDISSKEKIVSQELLTHINKVGKIFYIA
ncbi:nucleotidyltransferase family protein [Capnocytophaga sp.]|uniref:nucleotidyltransferase family protein n=1 Tax=Capnocytophaga sp. TaxID=44737 RepID=UPI0026DCABBD|nr:nucleotidyltransferase domain-containing protein [Capnocytophaga sp.]MDO5105544.1 nucleotidyltransferase domain-containing protein [Capnocytophaga sp.]